MSIGVARLNRNIITTVSNVSHCEDNEADRKEGRYWENQFSCMAGSYGRSRIEHQKAREGAAIALGPDGELFVLPDVTLLKDGQIEYHEIKHKNPTRFHSFGLEVYRFESLMWFAQETKQDVMYTIHNHDLAGGKRVEVNDINHWVTINVLELDENWTGKFWISSWVDGRAVRVPAYFWDIGLWYPLKDYWDGTRMVQLSLNL